MSLTLLEMAKTIQDPMVKGVIETLGMEPGVLEFLPMYENKGLAHRYAIEEELPGVSWRGINESFSEETGIVNPVSEPLFIVGGRVGSDIVLVKANPDRHAYDIHAKTKAVNNDVNLMFFKGNNADYPKQPDGLENRLVNDQVIDMGDSALTLAKLDELIDQVKDSRPDVLFMNRKLRRKVNALMRAEGQAQEIVSGNFGKIYPAYGGIPIVLIDDSILGFTETNDTASIYAVRFGTLSFTTGLQFGPVEAVSLGEINEKQVTRIQWIIGFALYHGQSAARLKNIAEA